MGFLKDSDIFSRGIPDPTLIRGISFEELLPAPIPFLPIPRGLIMSQEGLTAWHAYGVVGDVMEDLGLVYAESEGEALEAANERGGGVFSAYKVLEEE